MRHAVIFLVALGCQQELVPAPVTPPLPSPSPPVAVAHTPFLIRDQLVGEDGVVIRKIPDLKPYDVAIPDGPHRFKVRGRTVDTVTGAVTPRIEPAVLSDDKLVRYNTDGAVRWTVREPGWRSVRPPDVAVGRDRTVVAFDGEVRAYDDERGNQVWAARIPGYRLHVQGDTVYSTMCNEPTKDHWLIGTSLATGVEKFRVPLALGCDPWLTVTEQFVIAVEDRPAETRIFDLSGKLLLKLDEETQGTPEFPFGGPLRAGNATLLVTDKHLIAIDAQAHVVWKRERMHNTFVAANQVVDLPDGDIVVANYGAIDDSGVDLVRLHRDGTLVWHSCASPLGVGHSKYMHLAYAEARGDDLFVASQGSYGAFLEKLSVATGERRLRCVLDVDQNVASGCTVPAKACPE